jgi:hypothetical protein
MRLLGVARDQLEGSLFTGPNRGQAARRTFGLAYGFGFSGLADAVQIADMTVGRRFEELQIDYVVPNHAPPPTVLRDRLKTLQPGRGKTGLVGRAIM